MPEARTTKGPTTGSAVAREAHMDAQQREFCQRVARGIATEFGPKCEVVVHDLESADPDHTVIIVENGEVTGRKVGDGPSRVALEALRSKCNPPQDRIAYLTKTEDGRILKSTTIFLRNQDGEATGILAINYDITLMVSASQELSALAGDAGDTAKTAQFIPRSVSQLLDDLIEKSVELVGKPVSLMGRDDKVRAVGFLDNAGAFLITRAGQRVCDRFGISKSTLYSYLDAARQQAQGA